MSDDAVTVATGKEMAAAAGSRQTAKMPCRRPGRKPPRISPAIGRHLGGDEMVAEVASTAVHRGGQPDTAA
ncbi:hypothetical protein FJ970_10255 [Mesorhizobium sp. B2-1-8]|uniref:hypothetical protein n=1 Tax=unclassified Mesorhizobium TaxID=325217 RepID=UPI00112D2BFA|nr:MULTISPECIES: hypothetical protein [unclassified Mesorhizobium]MBZ9670660.1 hypothetical protein [Mesorhizobium sp. ES1-3]MBZ9709266.1 hypothetical protein [Mesorhizobium sp. ESP7-2]UCI21308.1 hypothetical protein FJ970_10255 [Mesorhizobium sp. B2-1-8]